MVVSFITFVLALFLLQRTSGLNNLQPEQIHLSYGGVPSEMLVTWVTLNRTASSKVMYGRDKMTNVSLGTVTQFVDGGKLHRTIYVHRAKMTGLAPGQTYEYVVGGNDGWSGVYHFKAIRDGTNWSPYLVVYGDMGNENPRALPLLQLEAESNMFDAVLHVGDFAYDMATDNALVGDEFMRQIETVAAYIPYMTCVGNHEHAYNFSHYRNRFTMPGGDGTGMYFSWNIGPAHIISFNTEIYFYSPTREAIKRQYDWLEADLKAANLNRAIQPWIITMGHKPMYCSNADKGALCTNISNPIRNGSKLFHPSLEDLFYKNGVDLQFYAHEHSYERLWPLYKNKVCNGSVHGPYSNPRAPVHIVTGSAGDREGQSKFAPGKSHLSAFSSSDYGFTRMLIANATHLNLQQVSIDKHGSVIDEIWIVKDQHAAGLYNC